MRGWQRVGQLGALALLVACLVGLAPGWAEAQVGTVTLTRALDNDRNVRIYTFTWVSDGAGNVHTHPQTVASGEILSVEIVPDTGATAPDPNYDLELQTTTGLDVIGYLAQNLAVAFGPPPGAPQYIRLAPPVYNRSTLDLRVSGAGAANGGRVIVVIR
ncbi:MAG: hypothetical protein KBA95_01835 [Acidobacteria bacterium]|nr:hypothetical protein [Acidobacteriota bacterium]